MATYTQFASVNGTLRQFLESLTKTALRLIDQGRVTRLIIGATGTAEDSREPSWLMVEDCLQGAVGYGGVVYWEPDTDVPGGSPVTLVVEAYDLGRRRGLRLLLPMTTGRKNPLWRAPAGSQRVAEIPVAEVAEPRYRDWDLARFAAWAEHELARGAEGAERLARYRGDSRIPEQRYAELAEYSGFAFVDGERTLRASGSRTGRYWLGKAMSLAWKPGREGAEEQLLELARDRSPDGEPGLALTAVWWPEAGLTRARFADLGSGQVSGGTWRIAPPGGLAGFVQRRIGLTENRVTRAD